MKDFIIPWSDDRDMGTPAARAEKTVTLNVDGFDVTVKPDGTTDTLAVDGDITLGPDAAFEHVDFAGYEDFASYIEAMDLFLYPLQFGSANWGLFELLFRGRTIIASDRCFIPEVIRNGYNGYLCKYDDIQAWVRLATAIIDAPAAHAHIGEAIALRD